MAPSSSPYRLELTPIPAPVSRRTNVIGRLDVIGIQGGKKWHFDLYSWLALL
jgi:hypothetical protein